MPPLAGPRLMLCCTRQPVKTCTEPLSMRTGKCTVSSRLTSRRPRRTSSERPITSAAASKRRWAVWKAETRVSTAMCEFRYYSRRLRVDGVKDNCVMTRNRILGIVGVAAVALATGFLLAGQIKAQLLTPSNQVARYQALVRSVQDLEKANESSRGKIAALRAEIDALEASAAQQSASTKDLQNQVADLRAHAGLTAVHGPGVEIDLGNGPPAPERLLRLSRPGHHRPGAAADGADQGVCGRRPQSPADSAPRSGFTARPAGSPGSIPARDRGDGHPGPEAARLRLELADSACQHLLGAPCRRGAGRGVPSRSGSSPFWWRWWRRCRSAARRRWSAAWSAPIRPRWPS